MTESVSFKAYLKRDGQEVEVRRFGIDTGAATNFMYLRGKIQAMFPSIQNDQFKIFWQDSDKDYIVISCDEELLEALTAMNVQPFKLFVHITTEEQGGAGQSKIQLHSGITCDACEGIVTGFRYKCVTCPDYDLCANCEAAGRHPDHFMLRVPWPVGPGVCPKFFRKFFGRPHKFHKFARHYGQASGFNMHEDSKGPGRCPFTRPAGGAAAPTSNMFDFSALMDFITSLEGAAAGETGGGNETTANAQTASDSQTPQPNVNSEQQTRPRTTVPQSADYLKAIEQAVSAFLTPFGIDMTLEASCNQPSGTPEASASAQPNASAQPKASASSATPQPEPTPTPRSTPSRETSPVPASATEKQAEIIVQPARRNSDDWTLVNRESPTRNEAVEMVVEVASGSQPVETPSAPPTPQANSVDDKTRERLQETIAKLRNMGFQHDTKYLRDTILEHNFDLVAVLEKMLRNTQTIPKI